MHDRIFVSNLNVSVLFIRCEKTAKSSIYPRRHRTDNPSCCDLANRHFQQSLFLHCSAFYRVVVVLLLVLDCGGVGALQCILQGAGGVGGE